MTVKGVPLRQRGPNRPWEKEPGVRAVPTALAFYQGALSTERTQTWRRQQG